MHLSKLARTILVPAVAVLLLSFTASCDGNIGQGGVITTEPGDSSSCNYNDNLEESADSFISRCRKGRIRREFPTEYSQVTLKEIKKAKTNDGKKAYKLLNDRRFKK